MALAEQHLKDSGIFVTGVRIGADNHIGVFIDGDNGVTIKDCVDLSRAIEGSLDRSHEDFSLDVSSHGATSPLVLPRQYRRHIGREFEIKLNSGEKAGGKLLECTDSGIRLEYSVREDKPVGKGKITVIKEQAIPYSEIKESRIKLKY